MAVELVFSLVGDYFLMDLALGSKKKKEFLYAIIFFLGTHLAIAIMGALAFKGKKIREASPTRKVVRNMF